MQAALAEACVFVPPPGAGSNPTAEAEAARRRRYARVMAPGQRYPGPPTAARFFADLNAAAEAALNDAGLAA